MVTQDSGRETLIYCVDMTALWTDTSSTLVVSKTFTDPITQLSIPYTFNFSGENLQDLYDEAGYYASAIEYGVAAQSYLPEDMFFPEEQLYQWISPQQMEQFRKMYPDCVKIAYQSALGYVYSQIGELYDLDAILAGDTDDGTSKIMRWILTVLTAYNLSSPSAKHSQTLLDNFDMVTRKVTEMKNGATTLHDAPIKAEPNAWGGVVNSSKCKMLG